MAASPNVSLVCIGPTGIGYYAVANSVPALNSGAYAVDSGAILICDAAIVASEIGTEFNTHLITNGLGISAESDRVRRHLTCRGITIAEDAEYSDGVPFDSIWCEQASGSRTFITSGFCPKTAHIASALVETLKQLERYSRVYLYIDAEVDSPPGMEVAAALAQIDIVPHLVFFNLGDVTNLASMYSWMTKLRVQAPTIFQASTDPGVVEHLVEFYPEVIIFTLGREGALLNSEGSITRHRCEGVDNASSVGAGAIVSAKLLRELMHDQSQRPRGDMVESAISEAATFVKHFNNSRANRISFW